MSIAARSLQHYDPQLKQWCVEPGLFEVSVGTSSADLPLCARFEAVGPNPYAYGGRSAIGTLVEDERARAVLLKYLPESASAMMLGILAQFVPDMPLEAMFSNWMAHMPAADETQVAVLKARLYAELSAIPV